MPNLKKLFSTSSSIWNLGFWQYPRTLDPHLRSLSKSLSPAVIKLNSSFFAPDNEEINHSSCQGAGVFVHPNLVLTSAHIVGRISTFYEREKIKNQTYSPSGCILHNSYIGSTTGIGDNRLLGMKPLAVNFASNLAVLEVVNPLKNQPFCKISDSPPNKEEILMNISNEHFMLGNVRGVEKKTVRAKAPWPLDDNLGWIEHNWFIVHGRPPVGSALCNSRKMAAGSVVWISGSPWFNLRGEIASVASWEATDDTAQFSVGFAVPPACIKAVLYYAKTKKPEDVIVMDPWIHAHMIPGSHDE